MKELVRSSLSILAAFFFARAGILQSKCWSIYGGDIMPKGNPSAQTIASEKYQKKAGYMAKKF